ncbi:MAG: ATP-binding protein [Moraxella sp.]|nr:ATP-binding protein [Moraxella sp.]
MRKALLKALQDNPKILEQIKNESDSKFNSEQFYENLNNPYNKSELTAFISSSNDNDDKLNFEFISTVNLNANSTQNLSLANGEIQNILDLEIQTELQRLLVINNEVLNKQLITALNIMFSESKKDVSLNDKFELEFKVNNEILNFPQLSSGERQVIYILLKVAIATKDNALILMDEPEISLHLSWQEKLLAQIREINPNSQIIIVTHSPAIVMNGWLDCFVDIQDIIVKG